MTVCFSCITNYTRQMQARWFHVIETQTSPCADPEVRHSNTEESILYFIRRNQNIFWAPSLILPCDWIRVWISRDADYLRYRVRFKNFIFLLSMKSLEKGQINFNSNQIHENNSREISWNLWFTKLNRREINL